MYQSYNVGLIPWKLIRTHRLKSMMLPWLHQMILSVINGNGDGNEDGLNAGEKLKNDGGHNYRHLNHDHKDDKKEVSNQKVNIDFS